MRDEICKAMEDLGWMFIRIGSDPSPIGYTWQKLDGSATVTAEQYDHEWHRDLLTAIESIRERNGSEPRINRTRQKAMGEAEEPKPPSPPKRRGKGKVARGAV
jgi:hypothetical protein